MNYYDGTKLLSLTDINGNKPELYLCTTNRSGGKTTWFNRYVTKRFVEHGEKFMLIYRYTYELDDCADKFFKDIKGLFFQTKTMTSKKKARGSFHELYINDVPCGYAVALNTADVLKKYSHFFSDVSRMIFDEFQSETNHYCSDEVKKLISIHTSVARGSHKQVRYVPVYMLSNAVSIINPYYIELGIAERLKEDTKFLRGDGFVLEQGFVQAACEAQKGSAFNRAFSRNSYVAYASQNIYLNDNKSFIEKIDGKSKYIATLKYGGCDYAIREYAQQGFIYCDCNADSTFPLKISVTTDDHQINYVMLKRNDCFLTNLRWFFDRGCFRFKDLRCKEAVLKALSY